MNAIGRPFVPGCPYENCFQKNANFEDHCYTCIHEGAPRHAYIYLYSLNVWLNLFLTPLPSDSKNIGYCVYSYVVDPKADSKSMANLSAETASEVLYACIKLRGSDDVQNATQDVVEDIRAICDSDNCCILLMDEEKQPCSVFAESLHKGTRAPSVRPFMDQFYPIAKTWEKTLDGSSCFIVKDEHDMKMLRKENPVFFGGATLPEEFVKSIVLFPLRYSDKLLGYMWAVNFNVSNALKIKETLELTTFFLASEISSYQLMKKLEFMSAVDLLTGVKNRNKMNNQVDQIVNDLEPMPAGVLFADLNGLKRINDGQDHATDQMLRDAVAILREVFYDGEVYRAGGDEFMILVPKISEEELKDRVAQMRQMADKTENVRFSVGFCHGHTVKLTFEKRCGLRMSG